MVMKPLKKSALREIKKNAGRYLAILAIIALGVGFFCGLRICKPAMLRAGDAYIRESNLFDYRLISTLGFTQEDEAYFAALDGVNAAEGAVWADFLYVDAAGNNRALRAHSLTREINRPSIVAGRMPEKADELIADARPFLRTRWARSCASPTTTIRIRSIAFAIANTPSWASRIPPTI